MNKVILDTNAYGAYLQGDQKVLNTLAATDTTFMSIFVLGELYAGFKGGIRETKNVEILHRFLRKTTVIILEATQETAEIFGTVKNSLKLAGTTIPINDVWIASHALETGSVIVTYDKHFDVVPGVRVWK
ncbi:MAG: type II toxin-antitoxin system VapC family toxin [SAR324 cluster bacterium]|nr:type II toxin-antitoxin system VapC family toxin [SAR324 cluster bacterium]MBL7035777.1 type II toxin-antitoxin system VapC family toxin [SAR324 cluster bacterium]